MNCVLTFSKVEWQLVQVYIAWDGTDFGAEACNLVSEHARRWDLDGIVPIIVIVAERIGKVEDGTLRDMRGILCNIEMCRFHAALGN